jgi:hypothetical protein
VARLNVRDHMQGGFWRALEVVVNARTRWEGHRRSCNPAASRDRGLLPRSRGGRDRRIHDGQPPRDVYAFTCHPVRQSLPSAVLGLRSSIDPVGGQLAGTNVVRVRLQSFPNMDTMVAIAIFSMMAIG